MKRRLLKPLSVVLVGSFFVAILSGFNLFQNKPWPVPDNYKNMKNPVAADATSIAEGKSLYATHCKSCHGAKGLGDGNKAAQLKTEPGNFSTADFHAQTDGALFIKRRRDGTICRILKRRYQMQMKGGLSSII